MEVGHNEIESRFSVRRVFDMFDCRRPFDAVELLASRQAAGSTYTHIERYLNSLVK